MSKTYNIAVGIPEQYLAQFRKVTLHNVNLKYSRHAREAMLDDRFGCIHPTELPTCFVRELWKLVELTIDSSGTVEKFVVRRPLDAKRDIVLVIMPDGFVKTLWINLSGDNHRTLNRSRIAR